MGLQLWDITFYDDETRKSYAMGGKFDASAIAEDSIDQVDFVGGIEKALELGILTEIDSIKLNNIKS